MGGCLFAAASHAQNLDLLEVNHSGKAKGMAGAGIATITGQSAHGLNPAGIAGVTSFSFGGSASFTAYSYTLSSETRALPSLTYYWNASRFRFDDLVVVVPIGNSAALGAGYVRKFSPYISNEKRAITGSTMFTQETAGDVNAFSVAAAGSLTERIRLGVSVYRANNAVQSNVRGDFHGRDIDKWATLRTTIEGTVVRLGLQAGFGDLRGGLVFDAPHDFIVRARKSISPDSIYSNLFPVYDETVWHIPGSIGVGVAYTNNLATTVALDLRFHRFEQTAFAPNLYEYGSKPTWNDLVDARAGVEFFPFRFVRIPLRFGYSYVPQLYSSIEAQGFNNSNILQILDYTTSNQNVLHTLTAGTSFTRGLLTIHVDVEYALLNIVRNVTGSFVTRDEYAERRFTLHVGIEYSAGS
jgi:hypothetical protein